MDVPGLFIRRPVATTLLTMAVALAVGCASTFAAYFAFQGFLTGDGAYMKTSLGDPGVLRAVVGGGLYLAVLGLFGLGLGAVVRSSAGAVAALLDTVATTGARGATAALVSFLWLERFVRQVA